MMSGVLLALTGTVVLCQIFGGDALGRLGITGASTATGGK